MLLKYQKGVSLVESMIALLIISVGLLGIAALQITAMKQNTSALNHSRAVWITYNISDRIRANSSRFDDYTGIDTKEDYEQDCSANACNTANMILADAADWKLMVLNLPDGRGIITSPSADELNIAVMWDDEGTGATGTNCGTNPEVDLTCYSVRLMQ
ncbi:MAG: type IV pilus assembly protein PilV [Gammaproteobacteria bacterium]|jgi:type IV pilus assembly protein PilV